MPYHNNNTFLSTIFHVCPCAFNILKEELNKNEALIKKLVEKIGNLTTNSLKQQPIQSQSFTSESEQNLHVSTARLYYKETNLGNTNMNTSTTNDDLRDKSTDIVPKKKQR